MNLFTKLAQANLENYNAHPQMRKAALVVYAAGLVVMVPPMLKKLGEKS